MRIDIHTHHYPPDYFKRIERSKSDFTFATDLSDQTIIQYRGARFFGITAPMTDAARRLEDMDRVGIDVGVLSVSTRTSFSSTGRNSLTSPGW